MAASEPVTGDSSTVKSEVLDASDLEDTPIEVEDLQATCAQHDERSDPSVSALARMVRGILPGHGQTHDPAQGNSPFPKRDSWFYEELFDDLEAVCRQCRQTPMNKQLHHGICDACTAKNRMGWQEGGWKMTIGISIVILIFFGFCGHQFRKAQRDTYSRTPYAEVVQGPLRTVDDALRASEKATSASRVAGAVQSDERSSVEFPPVTLAQEKAVYLLRNRFASERGDIQVMVVVAASVMGARREARKYSVRHGREDPGVWMNWARSDVMLLGEATPDRVIGVVVSDVLGK